MNTDDAKTTSNPDPKTAADDVTQGLSEVVKAALGIGVAFAKVFADATATKPAPPPDQGAAPLNAIIHYGLITVSNVVGMFVSGLGGITGTAKQRQEQPPPQSPGAQTPSNNSIPVVQRGRTMRIPLSIENPGTETMHGLSFACLEMKSLNTSHGVRLGTEAVRFTPEVLNIAPRDFEKLTVFIDAAYDTAPGRYEALIGLGAGLLEMKIRFDVVPETKNSSSSSE